MLKTLKIKLFPASEQRRILLDTMQAFNQACNELAKAAFEHQVFNKFELQKRFYSQIREDYKLGAQLTIRAIAKTVEAIKANRKKKKTSIPTFSSTGSIVYDPRCFRLKGLEAVSLLSLGGRQIVPIVFSGYHAGELAAYGQRGQADLIYTQGEFYLCIVVEVPEPPKPDHTVRKAQRRDRISWSFSQLRQFIEYKAAIAGVHVFLVDPRNTSRECIDCHHIDKRNRPSQSQFCCVVCGFAGHADHVAALNIRSRAAVNQPYAEAPELSASSVL